MSAVRIVLSRELPPALMQALESFGELQVSGSGSEAELEGASVYCSTALDAVDADLIKRFPDNLGLIANLGVGFDNIDLEAASARGIRVSNTPVVTEDTADLTWALLLSACRRLSAGEVALRSGRWQGQVLPETLGQRVFGKTLGIVGMGEIGRAVARRARGFSMDVIYHGPRRKPDAEKELGVRFKTDLDGLLAEADIVSLHCPLNESSRQMINAERLNRMKRGAVLVNAARGPLVSEADLAEALASGQIGAAGLDVFESEPDVSRELLEFPNVTLLPHIGSATGECRQDMALSALGNIKHFLDCGVPLNPVN